MDSGLGIPITDVRGRNRGSWCGQGDGENRDRFVIAMEATLGAVAKVHLSKCAALGCSGYNGSVNKCKKHDRREFRVEVSFCFANTYFI